MSSPMFNLGQSLHEEKLKIDGSNFTDRQHNLRIIPNPAKMSYALDVVLNDSPADDSSQDEKNNVSEHVVKRSDCVQSHKTLEYEIPDELAIDRVLQSLPPSYKQFVLNYKMHGMNKTLSEILAMLTFVDICRGDDHQVHNCPKYIKDEQAGKHAGIEKGICDIHVIDVYLTRSRSSTWAFDTGSIARICISPEELQNRWDLARD